jgi:lipopolysaccharide export system protein LptA
MRRIITILIFFSFQTVGRESGQTEITTDDGIEVFNQEKYYLLKTNVKIISDEYELSADLVKAYFNKDLYDITRIFSDGNVTLISSKGIKASGEKIDFDIINEDLQIFGKNSLFTNKEIIMISDEEIKINNITGNFLIKGPDSRLKSDTIDITGYLIKGKFSQIENINEVELLYVEDEKQINIKTETLDMYALSANYDKKINIIELFDNVKIIRDNESILGDYAKINTLTESYKVTSKESGKVKALLDKKDE